jgi:large subunit ribosomal protein L21
MYAVIKTGGKQYRVQAGDLLVVEKLDGEPGAKLAFDQVLMIGEGEAVTVGAPVIEGASVSATLVETRKGEKIKVFKKIRRQGYRRTRGHRQFQSVLRVTGIAGDGKTASWDGEVDLTPLAVLNARARNLARGMEIAEAKSAERAAKAAPKAEAAAPAKAKAAPKAAAKPAAKSEAAEPAVEKKAAPKKTTAAKPAPAKAKKAAAAPKDGEG